MQKISEETHKDCLLGEKGVEGKQGREARDKLVEMLKEMAEKSCHDLPPLLNLPCLFYFSVSFYQPL